MNSNTVNGKRNLESVDKSSAADLIAQVKPAVLGARLRRARVRQGLSVRSLAENAGISKTSIVSIESGHAAHANTVIKVCSALGLHLAGLCEPTLKRTPPIAIHRSVDDRWFDMTDFGAGPLGGKDRPLTAKERAAFAKGSAVPLLFLRSRLDRGRLLPVVIELFAESPVRSHPGEEFVYVLKGALQIRVAGEAYLLHQNESVTFWSAEEHSYAPAPGYKSLPVRILSLRIDDSDSQSTSL